MRYPVTLIPGLPVTPDVGIGITLNPVAPAPAPAPSAVSAVGGSGAASLVWANVFTVTPSAYDPLVLSAPYGDAWSVVATNQVFDQYVGSQTAFVIAAPINVALSDVITWSVDEVLWSGSATLAQTGADFTLSNFYDFLVGKVVGNRYQIDIAGGYAFVTFGILIDSVMVTCYRNGTAMGTLQLSIPSYA